MPQLVKGGKHVFSWSKVGNKGKIVIPSEAFIEYNLIAGENVILISGSKTSGGFGLTKYESLKESKLSVLLHRCPELAEFRIPEGTAIKYEGRTYCWVTISAMSLTVPIETLAQFGIKPGDRLLAVRGSGLALGFIVRGPIVEEAKKHPEIEIYG
jgi:bifunctional DNA-binding transcriptional regulator/antitoxin component of YhaV-PrlF toxin-antitoxin module